MARLRKDTVSVKNVLQGSGTMTRELLGGTKDDITFLPTEGSLIYSPGQSIIFVTKSKLKKIELVA